MMLVWPKILLSGALQLSKEWPLLHLYLSISQAVCILKYSGIVLVTIINPGQGPKIAAQTLYKTSTYTNDLNNRSFIILSTMFPIFQHVYGTTTSPKKQEGVQHKNKNTKQII